MKGAVHRGDQDEIIYIKIRLADAHLEYSNPPQLGGLVVVIRNNMQAV